jgi:hypothetical protein
MFVWLFSYLTLRKLLSFRDTIFSCSGLSLFRRNFDLFFFSLFSKFCYLLCIGFRPRVCHSCLHLRAENIRLSAELAALRVGDPVRQVRFLLADQVREFRHTSLQSHYMVARSELSNVRQALQYMNAALVSSDGERNALREIVSRCECVARPKSAAVSEVAGDAAPGIGAAESVAVGVLSGCFSGPAPGVLPAVCISCFFPCSYRYNWLVFRYRWWRKRRGGEGEEEEPLLEKQNLEGRKYDLEARIEDYSGQLASVRDGYLSLEDRAEKDAAYQRVCDLTAEIFSLRAELADVERQLSAYD